MANERSFRGSPTVLVDGRDPFADGGEAFGLACRVYPTEEGPAGSPTVAQLRAVVTEMDKTGMDATDKDAVPLLTMDVLHDRPAGLTLPPQAEGEPVGCGTGRAYGPALQGSVRWALSERLGENVCAMNMCLPSSRRTTGPRSTSRAKASLDTVRLPRGHSGVQRNSPLT